MTEAIQGVIFDLDGVLIHSGSSHRAAFEEVFQKYGVTDFNYGDYAGWRTRDVIADVLGRRGVSLAPEEIQALSEQKSRMARESLAASLPIEPAAGRVLADLAARYPLGLASSGSRASVDGFLGWTGSRSLFRTVLSSADVAEAKPDPEIYLRCAERMGVPGPRCLVVEDAVAGVAAGKAVGARVVGVAGTVAAARLQEAGADFVVSNLSELLLHLAGDVPRAVTPEQWTAVIPAAGKGSRLGFHRPKILYPVAGRMILEWMLDFLAPNYSRLVFVLSPQGSGEVAEELEKLIPGRFDIVIQETPTGMGDAVQLALPRVKTQHVSVVWGDQVTLQRDSVEMCQALHQGPLKPQLTCPTVLRQNPYIHFERDSEGRLCGLRQAREGDAMPERGESDTGFFCFETAALSEALARVRKAGQTTGTGTGEFNLLPVIPVLAQEALVLTPRVMRLEETMGINSSQDAVAVAEFLKRTHGREH